MWLMEIPAGYERDGDIYGIQVVNGIALVQTQYLWNFLKHTKNWKDVTPPDWPKARRKPEFLERVLHCHYGGLGDVLFITPVIEAYKRLYPDSNHIVSTGVNADMLLRGNPNIYGHRIEEQQHIGMDLGLFDDAILYDCIIAGNGRSTIENIYDIISEWAGIPLEDSEKHPRIHLSEQEIIKLRDRFQQEHGITRRDKIVVIQYESTTNIRNWELKKFIELANRIHKDGYRPVMFGHTPIDLYVYSACPKCGKELLNSATDAVLELKRKCSCGNEMIVDLTARALNKNIPTTRGLNIRQIASLIAASHAFVGIDSCGLHIAGAFNKLSLGIFSSFDGDLRLRYYPKARWIQAPYRCAPCFIHHISCRWKDEQNLPVPPCMSQITVDEVYREFQKLVNNEPWNKPEPFKPMSQIRPCPVCGSQEREFITRKGDACFYDCIKCQTTYTDKAEVNAEHYNDEQYWKCYENPGYCDGLKRVAQHITVNIAHKFKFQGSILEIGPGTGGTINELRRLGWKVKGVDISETAREIGKNLGYEIFNDIDIAKFEEWQSEEHYDAILLNNSLEHFEHPKEILRKAHGLLNDGGVLIVIAPVSDSWHKLNNKWAHINPFYPGEHSCITTKQGLKNLLNSTGFDVQDQMTIDLRENGEVWYYTHKRMV